MNAINPINPIGRQMRARFSDARSATQSFPLASDFAAGLDLAQLRFAELELAFDPDHAALWCDMRPSGRPSYTHALMAEIGDVQAAVRQWFTGLAPGAPAPFNYFICGSRTPGIYNLGGDLGHFVDRIQARDFASMRHYAHVAVTRQFENCNAFGAPIITIALVQGDALGGGFEHALSLDVIVAERSAKLGLPEVLFNLFPGMGAYSFISRRLDRRRAEAFIMSGKVHSGAELYEMGVVDVLAEDGEGEQAVRDYTTRPRRRFNMHRAVYEARRRVNPVTLQELLDVVDLWAETAMRLDERDLKMMLRLCAAQDRRLAGARDSIRAIDPA